ncbi:MAG: 2-oxo-4-hydroxy-4-carboxy-5-ureidoimidazoline decarboxylase [Pseudomonadota bacterium]
MTRAQFEAAFGSVYEHSPWVAERAFEHVAQPVTLGDVQARLAQVVDAAGEAAQLALLRAHPDLAGRAAIAGELTDDSRAEQAGSGLDSLSAAEFETFARLNDAYTTKFGFPFIMAVKGATKHQILAGFEARLPNARDTEFATALAQVHRIAGFRLAAWFEENSA